MALSPLQVVEACYTPAADERAWARGLVASLLPLRCELGVHAVRGEVRGGGQHLTLLASDAPGTSFEALLARRPGAEAVAEALFGSVAPVEFVSRRLAIARRAAASTLRRLLGSIPAVDALVVRGDDGERVAVAIAVLIAAPGAIPHRALSPLRSVAAHLSSALRLRRCVADRQAELTARSRADVIRRIASGRGRPGTPLEAEAIWDEFVEGRWSVVELADAGDSHVLLLRAGDRHDPRALTGREREVVACVARGLSNKEAAYQLGMSPTTVATHLCVAARKLGTPTRGALIGLFAR